MGSHIWAGTTGKARRTVAPGQTDVFMIVVLFTASFPYTRGGERNFLEPEIPYLAEAFERVVVVPERRPDPFTYAGPEVQVENGYSNYLLEHDRVRTFSRGIFSRQVYREILAKPWLLTKPAYLKRLLFFTGQAELTRSWLVSWLGKQELRARDCLFYTYWFDQGSFGIGLTKRYVPELKLVSRIHRYDLYEELRVPPYWPCREAALGATDFLFSASEAGTDYLCKKYPELAGRMSTARLGVGDLGILTRPSSDGIYRVVSCSRIAPVKRLDLIMDGIKMAAQRRPGQKFEWRHFGKGDADSLQAAMDYVPANMTVRILDYSSQADLFRYYRENPVDVFINVSASEGTPVSIMEAISCGIPVVATAVGGNTEIVSEQNGVLVDANPSREQIADALLAYWDEPRQRRLGSREVWDHKYNAGRNYPAFAKRLVEIRG